VTNAHLFDRPVFNGAGCNANVLNSLVFAAVLGLFSVVGGCAVTESVQDAPVAVASTNVSSAERIHDKVLVLDAHADIEYADAPSRYALPNGVSRVAPLPPRQVRLRKRQKLATRRLSLVFKTRAYLAHG